MPRHRKECIPKHRAQPPDHGTGRRAPLDAAPADEQPSIPQPRAPDVAETAPTVCLPILPRPEPAAPADDSRRARSRARRQAAAALRPRQSRRWRGMLVTPWFAAGAGFVIAAALALNSPHTVLTYKPNMTPCVGDACAQSGGLPPMHPGVQLKRARRAPVSHPPTTQNGTGQPLGAAVGFHAVWQRNGSFAAIITIPAQQASNGWTLSLRFPGRHITDVWGAAWRPSADGEGGQATALSSPWHSGRSGGWGGHHGSPGRGSWPPGAALSDRSPEDLRFLVTVQGSPVSPVGCVLNHAACHFS